MNIFYQLVCIVLLYLFIKYSCIAIYCLLLMFRNKYNEDKKSIIFKCLAVPHFVLETKIFHGGGLRYLIYHIGFIPSTDLRKFFYKCLGAKIEKNVVFHFKTEIRNPIGLYIKKGTIIGDNANLDARGGLVIGENVNLSSNVSIYTLQHDYRDPFFRCPKPEHRRLDVKINNRVWLGCNVVVLPGVTIGEGAVVCAGAVVTKDIEPYSVVAGIPAKKVAERPHNMTYEFKGSHCWFY